MEPRNAIVTGASHGVGQYIARALAARHMNLLLVARSGRPAVLHGFDPEQNPRLGFCYAVRDAELGEQVLSVGADFPYAEDPSLWSVLELVR